MLGFVPGDRDYTFNSNLVVLGTLIVSNVLVCGSNVIINGYVQADNIKDKNGKKRIDLSGALKDANEVDSVNFQDRRLVANDGVTVDWQARALREPTGGDALTWGSGPSGNRLLGTWKVQEQGDLSMGEFTGGGW